MSTSGTYAEKSMNRSQSSSFIQCAEWAIVCASRSPSDNPHRNESSLTRVSVGSVVHAALECDLRTRRDGYFLRLATLPTIEFARFRQPALDTGRANPTPGIG